MIVAPGGIRLLTKASRHRFCAVYKPCLGCQRFQTFCSKISVMQQSVMQVMRFSISDDTARSLKRDCAAQSVSSDQAKSSTDPPPLTVPLPTLQRAAMRAPTMHCSITQPSVAAKWRPQADTRGGIQRLGKSIFMYLARQDHKKKNYALVK